MTNNATFSDQPSAMRREDALDPEVVGAYVREHVPGLAGVPVIRQFRGGASNLTYQLDFGQKAFILRTAPPGTKAKSAHDMGREYAIMDQIKPFFPKVPGMIAYCDDAALLGRPFYIMEKMEGIILRANLPRGLELSPEQVRQLCTNAIDTLIALHSIDPRQAGLQPFGKGEGYIQRQVDGWSDRYRRAKTWNVPGFERVMAWLQRHVPAQEHICLIHNDFRFDNLVLSPEFPSEIIGVLDWEMATLGDPLMDLGNTLAYWVQADDDFLFKKFRRQPTHLPGMLTRREVVAYYCQKTGHHPENFTFYEVYGLFRLAAIVQQIYYRYHHGQTTNPAFRHFWILGHYLHYRCRRLMYRRTPFGA
jgi:aminoglycoside phosphotransferase (APT) family kinase protein